MREWRCLYLLCIMGLLFIGPVAAQEKGKADAAGGEKIVAEKKVSEKKEAPVVLPEIVVKGQIFPANKSPFSVNVLDSDYIESRGLSKAVELIREVPGVEMTGYNQGGVSNAFSMRGFSSGVHGGDMGIYLDGIPINEYYGHGGGYADPNVLIPLELDQVLVYKGPATALYGNFSRGGTVSYFTRKKGEYAKTQLRYGSNATSDAQVALGVKVSDTLWNNTAVQFYRSDGYTANSGQILGNASTRFTWDATENLEVGLSLRAHGDDWHAPGYMKRDQFDDDDRAFKTGSNQDDGGMRKQYSERVDLGYKLNRDLKLLLWGFTLQSDWTRFYTSGGAQTERIYAIDKSGTGFSVNYKGDLVSLVVGSEFFRDKTVYQQYNTSIRVRNGDPTSDRDTAFDNYSAFAEGELKLHSLFRPMVGVRYDAFKAKYTDNLTQTGGKIKAGDYDHVSPKAGFRSTLIDKLLDFRASVCNGFVLPRDDQLFVDDKLKPSEIWQYEAGITLSNRWFWWDTAGYILDTTNEITEDPPGSKTYRNYGKTRRKGVETGLKIMLDKWLEVFGNFGWTDTEILQNPNDVMVSKSLPQIPRTVASAGATVTSPWGPGGRVRYSHVGRYYIKNDNSETYGGYELLDLGVFYKHSRQLSSTEIAFEVKNVLNRKYAGFANADSNLWAVGSPRTYWVSANIKW